MKSQIWPGLNQSCQPNVCCKILWQVVKIHSVHCRHLLSNQSLFLPQGMHRRGCLRHVLSKDHHLEPNYSEEGHTLGTAHNRWGPSRKSQLQLGLDQQSWRSIEGVLTKLMVCLLNWNGCNRETNARYENGWTLALQSSLVLWLFS